MKYFQSVNLMLELGQQEALERITCEKGYSIDDLIHAYVKKGIASERIPTSPMLWR